MLNVSGEIRDLINDSDRTEKVLLAIVGVLSAVIVMLILGLALWGAYIAVDSWGLDPSTGPASVESKDFTPAHTRSSYNAALKMPQAVPVPDNWSLCLKVQNRTGCTSVTQDVFEKYVEGDTVVVKYVTGRISGAPYIEGIS